MTQVIIFVIAPSLPTAASSALVFQPCLLTPSFILIRIGEVYWIREGFIPSPFLYLPPQITYYSYTVIMTTSASCDEQDGSQK